ncbi:MAG: DUF5662 family protein [Oscillospiraceae bacterium]|nr:DUF5662 family protein [Oscillospiraceae bacterium]
MHDLSKFSPVEFFASAKYFQGNGSPVDAEKTKAGYSVAWQNHKGKNKHHWQYWTDFEGGDLIALKMPPKYLAEMICDWVGAGKAYNRGSWSVDEMKCYYEKNKANMILHASAKYYIEHMMGNVKSEAEIYRSWANVKRIEHNYFQDMCEGCSYQPPFELRLRPCHPKKHD